MTDLQQFLLVALRAGREDGFLTAPDLMRHITPEIMAAHLPRAIWAKLLGALVAGGKADPEAVMAALELETIVEHVPPATVSALLLELGNAQFASGSEPVAPAAQWGATSSSKAGPGEATVAAAPSLRPSQVAEAGARGPVAARPSAQWSRVSAPSAAAAMAAPSVIPGRRPQSAATVRAKPPTIEPKPAMADVELDLGEERLDAEELVDWNPAAEETVNFDDKRKR